MKIFKKKLNKLTVILTIVALILGVFGGLIFFNKPKSVYAAWFATGGTWNERQAITIDHTRVSTNDQPNFPVLIKITDVNNTVFTKALTSGNDIMFTAADATTALNYEIEKFDVTNHELDAWVKIPTLSHSANTTIYMYYGNSVATAPAASVAQGVWSNGYAGVWHLGSASGTQENDSTANLNNSTSNNTTLMAGQIDGSGSFDGTTPNYVALPASLQRVSGTFTISAWIKPSTLTPLHSEAHITTDWSSNSRDYILEQNNSNIRAAVGDGSNHQDTALVGGTLTTTAFHFATLVVNGTSQALYLDGTSVASQIGSYSGGTGAANRNIGEDNNNDINYGFNGLIDETRISNVARTPDWIATEYANQNSPTTFFGLNNEEAGDLVAPSNPTAISGYKDSGITTPIISGNYYNYATPYFVWPAAEATGGAHDTGNTYVSGVAGYRIYFGTSCGSDGGDPNQSAGFLTANDGHGRYYTTSPNITIPNLGSAEGTYCLRIKTVDNAGNVGLDNTTTWEAYSAYKYDITPPAIPSNWYVSSTPRGCSKINDFRFDWPSATDSSNTVGYQYERGDGSGDSWGDTITDPFVSHIISYTPTQAGDATVLKIRAVDAAGNPSATVQGNYCYSANAPSKPTNLLVNGHLTDTTDINAFSFSWTAPAHSLPIVNYGYAINPAGGILTDSNVNWTELPGNTLPAATTLASDHFATRQGLNTLYLVAKDDSGAYSFGDASVAKVDFNCTTVAQPIPSTVSITDSSDQASGRYMLTLQWLAGSGQDSSVFDHYSIERSSDGNNFSEIATSASTAYVDTGLNNATLYYYRIEAVDNAGAVSASSTVVSRIPTGKYSAPPTIVSEPTAVAKTTTAVVSWVVSRSTNAAIHFGTDKNSFSESQLATSTGTSHSIPLTGLLPSTKYYYQVQSLDNLRDYSLESAYSSTYTFETMVAPLVANVEVSNINLNSAEVTWETTSASNTKVYFGASLNYGFVLPETGSSMTTQHSIQLTNLTDTTRYHFKIYGYDIDGNILSSDDYVFDTLPMPKISAIQFQTDSSGPTPIVDISWLSNVPTSSTVKYSHYGVPGAITLEQSQSAIVSRHDIIINNLSYVTDYQFTVSGVDQSGNVAVSDQQVFKTGPNTRPPKISNIMIESSNVGSGVTDLADVVVYWKTDESATSQVAYDEGISGNDYKKKTPLDAGLTKNHIVVISGLKPGTPYHFQVFSAGASGNLAKGADQTVVTGQVTASVFSIVTRTISNIFGWLGL